jgi:hypothetical protein
VHEVAIVVDFEPQSAAPDMEAVVRSGLRTMGIDPDDDAAAVLHFDLDGTGLSSYYGDLGRCYTGARVSGTATLSAPDLPDRQEWISWELSTPFVVFAASCEEEPDGAPYPVAFSVGVIPVYPALWGTGAVPALLDVVGMEIHDTVEELPLVAAAMDAFRGLDHGGVSPADTRDFLGKVIDLVAYLVDTGFTPHGADHAARRVLTAFSGTDYGIATEDDVAEWRAWLQDWSPDEGS